MLRERKISSLHCYRVGDGGTARRPWPRSPRRFQSAERGVHFDVGHGVGSFSFDVAEKAMKQDLYPGTISSDLHQLNYSGPVFDLATTLSKFMILGMSLEQVIERASTNAARTLDFPQGFRNSARRCRTADVAVFELREGKFDFTDSEHQTRTGRLKLCPVATIALTKFWWSHPRRSFVNRLRRAARACSRRVPAGSAFLSICF